MGCGVALLLVLLLLGFGGFLVFVSVQCQITVQFDTENPEEKQCSQPSTITRENSSKETAIDLNE